jgi:hypothetical protein
VERPGATERMVSPLRIGESGAEADLPVALCDRIKAVTENGQWSIGCSFEHAAGGNLRGPLLPCAPSIVMKGIENSSVHVQLVRRPDSLLFKIVLRPEQSGHHGMSHKMDTGLGIGM